MNNQTSDELNNEQTTHDNGMGFNKADGYMLCAIAKFLDEHGFLTKRQLQYTQKRIVKYWRQVLEVANVEKIEQLAN